MLTTEEAYIILSALLEKYPDKKRRAVLIMLREVCEECRVYGTPLCANHRSILADKALK